MVDKQAQEQDELAALRSELERREAETASKERQLERYATDLRETFKNERQHRQELRASYVATVRALSSAVEARDAYTSRHAERVTTYGLELCRAAGLDLSGQPVVEFGFLLHDIGKIAIPDAILFKPEPLTREERLVMERHPVIGVEILREIHFLDAAKPVIRHHHERWDGGGYPDRLAGEAIPPEARLFAVADAFDALTTTRPYRAAAPFPAARSVIASAAGTQFDPAAVAALETISDARLVAIRTELT
jgi:ribonuclease P protein subunit RPR2